MSDKWNAFLDPERSVLVELVYPNRRGTSKRVEAEWAVCPSCRGEGEIFNPEAAEVYGPSSPDDPVEFKQAYGIDMFTTCPQCAGERLILVPRLSRLSAYDRAAYRRAQKMTEDELDEIWDTVPITDDGRVYGDTHQERA